jgi:mycobactin peptide synthetase MbtF
LATLVGAGSQRVLLTQWRALPDILSDADITALQGLWSAALQEVAS